jgi:orotidine-5'-phosphate decarboxylase
MNLKNIIVALDQMTIEEIEQFLSKSENKIQTVKIGLELYLKYGSELVRLISSKHQKKIFLDLKLHDIPVTVERAIRSLKDLPIDFLTIHLSGGEAMIESAVREARISLPACKILGVSFLTSLHETDLINLFGITNSEQAFLRLFKIAEDCGIDGVVCSPHEISLVKNNFPDLLVVTPGIRFEDEILSQLTQDQKRVATPKEALALGADYLVLGRSLTQAKDLSHRLKEF